MRSLFFIFHSIGNGGIERNARNISKGSFHSFVYSFKDPRSKALLVPNVNLYQLLKALLLKKKGIIYIQNFRLLLPGILFKIINRGELVYHIPIRLRSGVLYTLIYKTIFLFVDRIVVSTNKQKVENKFLSQLKKCIVQPYPMGSEFDLDIPYQTVLFLDKTVRFLFIGRIAYQKGLDIFIKIIKELNSKGIKCEGHVYGLPSLETDYVNTNLSLIKDDQNLFYHGECSVNKSIFEEYDCLLFTSRYEGYGILLAEALVSGIPILSSKCDFGPQDISCSQQYFDLIDDYENIGQWISAIQQKGKIRNNWDATDIYSVKNYIQKVLN